MSVLPMLSVAVSFLLTLFFLLYSWKKQKQYQFLPPGPAPLPLLGTPKYFGEDAACKYFPELCRKYGPVFTIWKLTEPMVVLCGYEVVKDALLNHAEVFSGRPFSPVIDLYSEGHSFPSIEGEKWRQLRRFTMATLRNFGMGKMSMEKLVVKESQHLVQAVAQTEGKQFNVVNVLGCAVGNIISYTLLGEHFDYQHPELQKLVTTTRQFIANTHSPLHEFCNTFPVVLKMPFIRKRILKESSDLISFVKKYIEPHRQTLNPSSPRDFIDYYLLKIKEEEKISGSNFNETSLLMSLISLIGAGTETTSCTLNFILCVLANEPDVQAKVQQEIDEVIGSQRLPENVDRAQMPYTNAIIHELQRILDLAPIAHYHAVTEDIKFRGYTLPKGIAVVPFLTSVHFDPTQWETPKEFNPGHFLDDEGKFRLNPAFMPFSAGKRVCAGENMARMELFLILSALLQKFTFTLPPGQERQDCKKLKQMELKSLYLYELCAEPRSTSSTA